jgi:phage terminase large subunit-like protein
VRPQDAAVLARLAAARPDLEAELARREDYKFARYFPDAGPLRRELYVPHAQYWAAGLQHRERVFLAANRIGKTDCVAFEDTCHLTGRYPPWWPGRRFPKPVRMWAAGDTMQTTRDIVQVALMGPHDGVPRAAWSGMIPARFVHHTTRRAGSVANCLEYVYVKHFQPDPDRPGRFKQDGLSCCQFKSYDQGQRTFQGTEQEIVWLDEEPPESVEEQTADIYTECLLRLMTTDGMLQATFTPLRGLTRFVEQYLRSAVTVDRTGASMPALQYFFPEGLEEDVTQERRSA